jgi:hypothetical protein
MKKKSTHNGNFKPSLLIFLVYSVGHYAFEAAENMSAMTC